MRVKPSKTEKKKSADPSAGRALRRVLVWVAVIVLVALIGVRIFSLIMPENSLLAMPGKAVAGVVTPVQSLFSRVVDAVADYLYKLKLRATIELEYNNLKQENETLVYQAMLSAELQQRLSVYEKLFDQVSENENLNPLVCTVIARESGNYFSTFTLNRGSNDGVADFMAVTMDGALVGYTYNTTATKCDVRAIIDSEASIAGLISSSRDEGTVRGTLGVDGTAMCRMYYLPEDHLPRPGDLVVTSGVGMGFPKGIPIGTVRESTRGMESNKSYIVVEPTVDFQHIEYVIVLRYQPTAGAVEARTDSSDVLSFTPLDTAVPVPTIKIGNDFFQLAPTPEPTGTPSVTPADPDATPGPVTPGPTNAAGGYEYQVPDSFATGTGSASFTLPPTATPTPTLEPFNITVEAD